VTSPPAFEAVKNISILIATAVNGFNKIAAYPEVFKSVSNLVLHQTQQLLI
jgi:hypothetical protein